MWIQRLSTSFGTEPQRDSDGACATFASDLWLIMFARRSRFMSHNVAVKHCCRKERYMSFDSVKVVRMDTKNTHAPAICFMSDGRDVCESRDVRDSDLKLFITPVRVRQ